MVNLLLIQVPTCLLVRPDSSIDRVRVIWKTRVTRARNNDSQEERLKDQ